MDALSRFSGMFASSAIARKANTGKRLTALQADQLACVQRLETQLDRVLACPRRDSYLRQLCHCVTTFSDADRDEPLNASFFSVYECFRTYTQELVYFEERFDFLLFCVLHRVCTVHKPRLFHQMLDSILVPAVEQLAAQVGGELLARLLRDDAKKESDEVARIEAFVLKKDWNKKNKKATDNSEEDDDDELLYH